MVPPSRRRWSVHERERPDRRELELTHEQPQRGTSQCVEVRRAPTVRTSGRDDRGDADEIGRIVAVTRTDSVPLRGHPKPRLQSTSTLLADRTIDPTRQTWMLALEPVTSTGCVQERSYKRNPKRHESSAAVVNRPSVSRARGVLVGRPTGTARTGRAGCRRSVGGMDMLRHHGAERFARNPRRNRCRIPTTTNHTIPHRGRHPALHQYEKTMPSVSPLPS